MSDAKLREIARRLVERGIRIDTIPDHWRCAECGSREPHVHTVVVRHDRHKRPIYEWRDYGYDMRDE